IAKNGSPTFTALPKGLPCTYAPGDPLSTTTNALWLACASSDGSVAGAYVSPDFGSAWTPAASKLTDARVAIGAVDAKSAITTERGRLIRVSSDGSTAAVSQPKV